MVKVRCVRCATKKIFETENVRIFVKIEKYKDTEVSEDTIDFFEWFDELWLDDRFYITSMTIDDLLDELHENREYYKEEEIEKIEKEIKEIYELCDGESGGYIELNSEVK